MINEGVLSGVGGVDENSSRKLQAPDLTVSGAGNLYHKFLI
jgi:hypothetical protein